MSGEVWTDVMRDEAEGKQMAEGELQPGSLGQALGLKFNLNFLFVSLSKPGKGKEEGGGREERRGRENFMLKLFTEFFI